MSNEKFSDLTTTTTFSGADLLAIVQGGVSKRIGASDFGTAIAAILGTASTSTAGVAKLATNSQAATGTDAAKIITAAALRYAGANGVFQSLNVNGATGITNTGDVNITGNFTKNGVALSALPQITSVPVSTSGTGIQNITVDFTTYAAYEFIIPFGTTFVLDGIDVSQNAGSSLAGKSTFFTKVATTTLSNPTSYTQTAASDDLYFKLIQRAVGSPAMLFASVGGSGSFENVYGTFGTTAAINQIRFTFDNTTPGGNIAYWPTVKR